MNKEEMILFVIIIIFFIIIIKREYINYKINKKINELDLKIDRIIRKYS